MKKPETTKNKHPHPGGRPPKYRPEFCKMIVDYFDIDPRIDKDKGKTVEEASPMPFLSGFAKSISVDRETLWEWSKKHPEFSAAYKRAKELQTEFIMHNALRQNYSAPFAIFTLKNVARWRDAEDQSWVDKQEITGKDGKDLPSLMSINIDGGNQDELVRYLRSKITRAR